MGRYSNRQFSLQGKFAAQEIRKKYRLSRFRLL